MYGALRIRLSTCSNSSLTNSALSPVTIITRFRNDYSTGFDVSEAMCRYGPQNKIFAEGVACHTIKQALRNLLKTTSVVIGILYEDGKLQPMVSRIPARRR